MIEGNTDAESAQVEHVGYRYSQDELLTLAVLQSASSIPCLPRLPQADHTCFSRGLESLEYSGIIMKAGGRVLVDKVQGLLVSEMCKCSAFLTLEGKGCAAICKCDGFYLLVRQQRSGFMLYAERKADELDDLIADCDVLFPEGTVLKLYQDEEAETVSASADDFFSTVKGLMKKLA